MVARTIPAQTAATPGRCVSGFWLLGFEHRHRGLDGGMEGGSAETFEDPVGQLDDVSIDGRIGSVWIGARTLLTALREEGSD